MLFIFVVAVVDDDDDSNACHVVDFAKKLQKRSIWFEHKLHVPLPLLT